MLTERVNKRRCGIEREEKPTSVFDRGKKRNRFQNPWLRDPQYTETGSEEEEVLTGCPSGGCCLCTRMEVCVCEHASAKPIWMTICHVCFVCAYMCVCAIKRQNHRRKAHCLRGDTHPEVCQSAVWEMTANCIGEHVQCSSR